MELMMAMAIVAILISLIATPVVEGIRKYRLTSAAQSMASEIERARSLAQSQGGAYEVQIDKTAGTLRVVDLADTQNPIRTVKRLGEDIQFKTVPASSIRMLPRGYVRGGSLTLQNGASWEVTLVVPPSGKTQIGPVVTSAVSSPSTP